MTRRTTAHPPGRHMIDVEPQRLALARLAPDQMRALAALGESISLGRGLREPRAYAPPSVYTFIRRALSRRRSEGPEYVG